VLGVGGFGITYLAADENLRVEVAIKEYLPGDLSSRESDASVQPMSGGHADAYRWGLERFMIEARTLARFKHQNIVEVRSVFEANRTAYMVMAYETGDSLADVLARNGTLGEEQLKALAMPILDGLAQVHATGFIHRDIKPSNIYLRRDGQPVLLDFGAARQAVGERTRTLTSVLSPGYAPFEQYFSNADKQGPWTDIYGLGATLYHGVTGRAPLAAVDRSEGVLSGGGDGLATAGTTASERYSAAFLAAIDHALAFRPEDRPQNVAAWRAELCASSDPTTELEPVATPADATHLISAELPQIRNEDVRRSTRGASQRPAPAPRRNGRMLAALVICAAVALAATGGYFWWERSGTPDTPARAAATVQTSQPPPEPAIATATPDPGPASDPETESRTDRIAALMSEAEAARAAGRLVTSGEDSAAGAYRAVLAIDPQSEAAQAGLGRIASELTQAAEIALNAGELAHAATAIEQLRGLDPEAASLPDLQAGLERGQTQQRLNSEVYQLLASAQADFDAGRIIAPEGDNALEKYREVESLRPGMGAVKKAYIDIGNHLLELADQASKDERFDEAYAYLDTAKSILPEREEIDSAREYVDNRRMTYEQRQRRRAQTD